MLLINIGACPPAGLSLVVILKPRPSAPRKQQGKDVTNKFYGHILHSIDSFFNGLGNWKEKLGLEILMQLFIIIIR